MKRTEKIEIRVSSEEKLALATLAQSEGRAVSKLIRDVLGKYMALNTPVQRPKRVLPLAALALCTGLIIGSIISLGFTHHTPENEYMVQGTIGNAAFGFAVNEVSKSDKVIKLGSGENELYVKTLFIRHDDIEEKKLRIEICLQRQNLCAQMAKATLELDRRFPSVWQTKSANGQSIFVSVQALKA